MEPNQQAIQTNAPSVVETNNQGASVISGSVGNIASQNGFKKKGGKTGIILGFVFLFLVAAGGVGFGIWGMMDAHSEKDRLNKQIEGLNERIEVLSEENEKLSKQSGKDEEGKGDTYTVETDSWDAYVSNMRQNSAYASYGNGRTVTRSAIVSGGSLSIRNESSEIFKLDGVIAVYRVDVGSGLAPYFYIVREDGSVYRTNLRNEEISFERIGEYTRVVSIVTSSDYYALLIDIDGNIYRTT